MPNHLNQSIPESWAGLEKYKQALQEIDGKTKESTAQVEQLLQLMGKAGPSAAELAESVKSGPLFVLATAKLAMDEYFDWVAKAQEKHKEMLATLVQFNHFQHELVATTGDDHENRAKIAQATAAANAQQNGVAETLKQFEAKDRGYDQVHNDQLAGDIATRKAESSVQMQQIDMLEAAGKITPAQAAQARIETQHQENLAAIQDRRIQAGSDLRSAQSTYDEELKTAGGRDAFSPAAIGAAEGKVLQTQGEYDRAVILANKGQKEMERIDDAIKHNREERHRHGAEVDPADMTSKSFRFNGTIDALQQQKARLKKEMDEVGPDRVKALGQAMADAKQHLADIQGLPEKFAAMAAAMDILRKKKADQESLEPKLLAAEDQRAATEKIAALEKAGETPGQIFQQGIKAMNILNGMTPQSIEGLQHGDAPQVAYIQYLLASKAAIGDLETAIGNNGKTMLEQIDRALKMNSDITNRLAATHSYAVEIESRLKTLESQFSATGFHKQ